MAAPTWTVEQAPLRVRVMRALTTIGQALRDLVRG
jgi:hypothetical protein